MVVKSHTSFALDAFDVKEVCESEKGVWREFGNDCANNCALDTGRQKMCIPTITYGCNCPKDQCWDYYKCVDNKEYQTKALEDEEKRIEELKKNNPELFLENLLNFARQVNKNPNSQQYPEQTTVATTTKTAVTNNELESGQQKTYENVDQIIEEQMGKCAEAGGFWQEFPDGCSNNCFNKKHPSLCSSQKTQACNCGDDKCWNGSSCVTY